MADRMWHERRDSVDAPSDYDVAQADAWASGWNACVEEYTRQVDEAFQRELP